MFWAIHINFLQVIFTSAIFLHCLKLEFYCRWPSEPIFRNNKNKNKYYADVDPDSKSEVF